MSKYRIVPGNKPNFFNVERKGFLFWSVLCFDFASVNHAKDFIEASVNTEKATAEKRLRQKSWKKAVPPVYFDKDGKIVET